MLVLMVTNWVMSSALRSPASSCDLGNNRLPRLAQGTVVAQQAPSPGPGDRGGTQHTFSKGGQRIMAVLILVLGLLNLSEVSRGRTS